MVLREGDLEPAAGARRVRLAHATAPGDALVEEAFTSVNASGEFVIEISSRNPGAAGRGTRHARSLQNACRSACAPAR
ncbi:MAG: hypothetical protein U1E76_05350 [Planctomycetota bacterium]